MGLDETDSWVSPFRIQSSIHLGKSPNVEVVNPVTEDLVEEKRAMVECAEQSTQDDAGPGLFVKSGTATPDLQILDSLLSL